MLLKCELETRISKANKPYQCLVIHLTDTLEKIVMLDRSEQEVLRLVQISPNSINDKNK